jgi:signal transduction histidine kinase
MKKLLKYLVMGCAALMFSAGASAEDKGTADEAVAMVKKAGEFLKKHGKEKAFAEFNNPKGAFIRKDLYIFAFLANGDGVEQANGANVKLVGKNVKEMKDADGKFLIKDILALGVGQEGKGWIDYKWPNPATGNIDAKRTYVERVDDVILGCGVYK